MVPSFLVEYASDFVLFSVGRLCRLDWSGSFLFFEINTAWPGCDRILTELPVSAEALAEGKKP